MFLTVAITVERYQATCRSVNLTSSSIIQYKDKYKDEYKDKDEDFVKASNIKARCRPTEYRQRSRSHMATLHIATFHVATLPHCRPTEYRQRSRSHMASLALYLTPSLLLSLLLNLPRVRFSSSLKEFLLFFFQLVASLSDIAI